MEFPAPPADKGQLEEGAAFSPRFDRDGLVTAIVTDARDGTLLMVAHMNATALGLTLETGIAHYWSRSRGTLWKKGETSGNLQRVVEMRTDCDQDAVWLKVEVAGHDATCHTGRRSCFYRTIILQDGEARLVDDGTRPQFDPSTVYGDKA
ncbi:phosphoribosyl-AMP cyclohydrolase [Mesorhizobium sp. CAU 1741]|uniref:phosphoribosyl-AMP cyclohydrolase n=1 Tax=Mesorhizobium sp. CAU 1741 TaxID=3140366 RepID=UPI00325B3A5E